MEKQKKIIEPVSVSNLLMEIEHLTRRSTNYGGDYIYITDTHKSPYIMKEIGRLREKTFREMGAGTGNKYDIDDYDLMEDPFQQLFVWDPENNEITGAYRFILMDKLTTESPTSHLFDLQPDFQKKIKPYSIELGRSFVNFDAKKARHGLYNLWDGLGYLIKENPDIKYFFGKMTMYPWILEDKLDILLSFLDEMFPSDGSVLPKESITVKKSNLFNLKLGFQLNRKLLLRKFKEGRRKRLPPLVDSYMKLSSTMKYLGASINVRFGDVVEACILVTIADIDPKILYEHTKQI